MDDCVNAFIVPHFLSQMPPLMGNVHPQIKVLERLIKLGVYLRSRTNYQVNDDQTSFLYGINAKLLSAPLCPPLCSANAPKNRRPSVSCYMTDKVLCRSAPLAWNPFPQSYSLPLVNMNLQGTCCINCNLLECSY